MPVNIRITGPANKDEHVFAERLAEIFREGLSNDASGNISIINNAQLFGQNPRDVDLMAMGRLQDARFNMTTDSYQSPGIKIPRVVWLNSFCFCIEVKQQPHENIEMIGTNLIVKYGTDSKRDATTQSEDQKYSLLNYIRDHGSGLRPWICNFLWMLNLDDNSIRQLVGNHPHNILPNSFSLGHLLEKAFLQFRPREMGTGNHCEFSSIKQSAGWDSEKAYLEIDNLLTAPSQAIGKLSRRNVERITGREVKIDASLEQALGQKLVIIMGRAGTGKTIKMLRIGCELASDRGRRCLFLTYNRALVNDIERSLYFAEVPMDFDGACMAVMTIHEFVRKIGIAFGLVTAQDYDLDGHIDLCSDILEYIEAKVTAQEDIFELMHERQELASWDHIFVDEAQDFDEIEKRLLFKFFGYQKLVIADGIDQFVRGAPRLDWGENIYVIKAREDRSLRQKRNLASFANAYARECNLDWRVEIVPELLGGRVIVVKDVIPFQILADARECCYAEGNKAFEMMFLVPPSLVSKIENGRRGFQMLDKFDAHGFKLWDGTRDDLRSTAPLKIDQHRLLQYDSCRGLEGWCVVCLAFDDFFEYKRNSFAATQEHAVKGSLVAMDSEEMCRQFVGLWSLIPLTRAIDTLIITLSNPESKVAEILSRCADRDYVEFVD